MEGGPYREESRIVETVAEAGGGEDEAAAVGEGGQMGD